MGYLTKKKKQLQKKNIGLFDEEEEAAPKEEYY
jgi:hypothetical protein